MNKRIISVLMAVAMLFGTAADLPREIFNTDMLISASAEGETVSGSCGDNVTWNYSGGMLSLSGSGDMYDYDSPEEVPWHQSRYRQRRSF